MAVLTYTDQIVFTGKGYLDSKMQPVATVEDLQKIPRIPIPIKSTQGKLRYQFCVIFGANNEKEKRYEWSIRKC